MAAELSPAEDPANCSDTDIQTISKKRTCLSLFAVPIQEIAQRLIPAGDIVISSPESSSSCGLARLGWAEGALVVEGRAGAELGGRGMFPIHQCWQPCPDYYREGRQGEESRGQPTEKWAQVTVQPQLSSLPFPCQLISCLQSVVAWTLSFDPLSCLLLFCSMFLLSCLLCLVSCLVSCLLALVFSIVSLVAHTVSPITA